MLLEEHTPSGLGNPAAMITTRDDAMLEQARTFLAATGLPRASPTSTSRSTRAPAQFRFFEVNPRIGRNNYYVTAAGANPMRFVVEDAVEGRSVPPVVVDKEILYSVVPHRLLLRVRARPAARRAGAAAWSRPRRSPTRCGTAGTCRRAGGCTCWMALVNQVRKFRRYYPEVTRTGF